MAHSRLFLCEVRSAAYQNRELQRATSVVNHDANCVAVIDGVIATQRGTYALKIDPLIHVKSILMIFIGD